MKGAKVPLYKSGGKGMFPPLMLDIAINLVIIAHVVVSLLMILVILMQRPKQEGLGAAFGSGMTDAAWGARTTDVLQKGTVYLGTLFFLLSLTLGILTGRQNAKLAKNFASDGASEVETPVDSQGQPASSVDLGPELETTPLPETSDDEKTPDEGSDSADDTPAAPGDKSSSPDSTGTTSPTDDGRSGEEDNDATPTPAPGE